MDNSFTYGTKLKMDLSFNNTNLKLMIIGSRSPLEYETYLSHILSVLPKEPFQLISFQSAGIDELTQRFALENNYDIYFYTPVWDKFCRSGGYIRNMEIVEFLKQFSKAQIIYLNNSKEDGLFKNLKDLCICNGIAIKKIEIKSQD